MDTPSLRKFLIVSILIILGLLSLSIVVIGSEEPKFENPEASPRERAHDLLERMTLEEKIGQMTQVSWEFLDREEDISEYNLGSILAGGGSNPPSNDPETWINKYNRYQKKAVEDSRLGIPILFGIDAVHGHNNVEGAIIFPHNVGMGSTWNPELVKKSAQATARAVKATGMNWTFSPVVDVARDDRWGRTYESFSEDPYLVGEMGKSKISGYQGNNISEENSILATAKHFVASGGTTKGVDQGNFKGSERVLWRNHINPFIDAVNNNVKTIMASYASVNNEKVHGRKDLLTDVLKHTLGFDEFILSDWGAIDQVDPTNYQNSVKKSINAGIDMNMVPDDYKNFIQTMKNLVEEDKISKERINKSVLDILEIKFRKGLFEDPYVSEEKHREIIGSEEHQKIARQAVRESMVLLKNDNVLPLSEENSLLVTGPNADDGASQCGGWTIGWQSAPDPNIGTSILEAIKKRNVEEIKYSRNPSNVENHDVALAVIGEDPYAEFEGDTENLSLPQKHLDLIDQLIEKDIPTIVLMISGRPRTGLEEKIEEINGLVMGWLPGTEGEGVTDVLYGDYNPSGKLSRTWPTETKQLPINHNSTPKKEYEPLFEFGHGLSYTEFTYDNLSITPKEIGKKDNLTVRTDIKNTGNRPGSEVIKIYLNPKENSKHPERKLLEFKKINLSPQQTKNIELEFPRKKLGFRESSPQKTVFSGNYNVKVDEISKSFKISPIEDAKYTFSNLKIENRSININENTEISFTAKNIGEVKKSHPVEIKIGEKKIQRETTIPPSESKKISIPISKEEPGTYKIIIDDLETSLTVTEEDNDQELLPEKIILIVILIIILAILWKRKKQKT